MHEHCGNPFYVPPRWPRIILTAILTLATIGLVVWGTWLSFYRPMWLAYAGVIAFILLIVWVIVYGAWEIAGEILK